MPSSKYDGPFKGFMSSAKIAMPKYQPSETVKQEKNDQMYPIKWPSYNNNDVQKRIENVLGPLSLFAPFPHEDEPEHQEIELERPVTPINEEIKVQPSSYERLAKYLRRRIAAKPDVSLLSIEDQQNLAAIIMAEVSNIWPDIRRQIDDPFLSAEENKELNRRIAVHIVTVAEKLFHHYLEKAKVLNSRGVFSGPANMSRLKAQLALDSNKFFNILMIRRYIVNDMRGKDEDKVGEVSFLTSGARSSRTPGTQEPPESRLTYQGMIQSSRPKSKLKKYNAQSSDQHIKEMNSCMPSLDTGKLLDLVADLPERDLTSPSEDTKDFPSRISEIDSDAIQIDDLEATSRNKVLLKRSKSMQGLNIGEGLLEELGEDIKKIKDDKLLDMELDILLRDRHNIQKGRSVELVKQGLEPGTREYIHDDLHNLLFQQPHKEEKKIDEDLPPLIQAIIRHSRHDDLKMRMDKKLQELEEKEKQRKKEESIIIRQPTKPQPATINSKLSNKLVVKTADVRVSERVCMSSIVLDQYHTVYNDLLDEIDPATIKNLDKNLFLSEEIREVYKEIMNTIPTQHLQLDNDAMFMPSAENINFTGTMASASLQKKVNERVINPDLKKGETAPWGNNDPKNWANIPSDELKNLYKDLDNKPVKKFNMDTTNFTAANTTLPTNVSNLTEMPQGTKQKISSWLTWWRNTVTSDDYMKYLSTQETDYLGAIYHFYDSEDEDDDDVNPSANGGMISSARGGGAIGAGAPSRSFSSKSNVVESKERQEKRKELLSQKEEYKDGYWNVNTILLGGLGRDPLLEEKEEKVEIKEKPQSAKTLSERAAAAREAKIQSRGPSAFSKSTTTPVDAEKLQQPEVTAQDRLEKVWTALLMPDGLKLDMAIKYSCNEYFNQLPEAIEYWEHITNLILRREDFMKKLEKFERKASDPNRFFEKGHSGSSVKRLEEAKQRSFLYKKIDQLEEDINKELEIMKEQFQDEITYGGRLYTDKMKWDRIEMLYWLQEERKEHGLRYEAAIKEIPLKLAQLEPLQH